MKSLTQTIVIVAVLSVSGVAGAVGQRSIGVLGIDAGRGVSKALVAGAERTAKGEVSRAFGYRLGASKALDEVRLVFGCVRMGAKCMARAGAQLGVDRVLWGALRQRRSGLSLRIWLVDSRRKVLIKSASRVTNSAKLTEDVAGAVRAVLAAESGVLELAGARAGATVQIDGQPAGTLPAQGVLTISGVPVGRHQISITGDPSATRSIVLSAGERLRLALGAAVAQNGGGSAGTDPSQGPSDSKLAWKITAWSGAAATAGLVVGLIVNGLKVRSLQDDKDKILRAKSVSIETMLQTQGPSPALDQMIAQVRAGCDADVPLPEIADTCSSGDNHALIQNVLIGLTVAVAGVTGFGMYKAYFSGESKAKPSEAADDDDDDDDAASKTSRWSFGSSITADGARASVLFRF